MKQARIEDRRGWKRVARAAAGVIMDNYNPNWVWYACSIISTIAIASYLLLHSRTSERLK